MELDAIDREFTKGKIEADLTKSRAANLVLPRAVVGFDKEATFRLLARMDGGEEREILTKKIIKGPTS